MLRVEDGSGRMPRDLSDTFIIGYVDFKACGFRSCGLDYMKFKPYVSSGLWPGISSPCFTLLKVLRKVV